MIEMNLLQFPEKRRTYIYKSGYRFSIDNVIAVKNEDGWDRIKTQDGLLITVLTVIQRKDHIIDVCVAREIDTPHWSF